MDDAYDRLFKRRDYKGFISLCEKFTLSYEKTKNTSKVKNQDNFFPLLEVVDREIFDNRGNN